MSFPQPTGASCLIRRTMCYTPDCVPVWTGHHGKLDSLVFVTERPIHGKMASSDLRFQWAA